MGSNMKYRGMPDFSDQAFTVLEKALQNGFIDPNALLKFEIGLLSENNNTTVPLYAYYYLRRENEYMFEEEASRHMRLLEMMKKYGANLNWRDLSGRSISEFELDLSRQMLTNLTFTVSYDSFFGGSKISELAKEWKKLKIVSGDLKWTPYFPSVWPIDKNVELVSYGYIERSNSGAIADGVELSEPFLSVSFKLPTAISSTMGRLVELKVGDLKYEIQGMRPLNGSESEFASKHLKRGWVDESLSIWKIREKIGSKLTSEDQQFFCMWAKLNTVIFHKIKDRHQEFFRPCN